MSQTGLLSFEFTHAMRIITDLSQIDTTALELELQPHESNLVEEEDALSFEWTVNDFGSNFMTIQIEWKKPF